jgi:hypothetical protein
VIRSLFDKERVADDSFKSYMGMSTAQTFVSSDYAEFAANMEARPVPSYEFFAEAAAEIVPPYKVEKAKSGRSACQACRDNAKSKAAREEEDRLEEEALARGEVAPKKKKRVKARRRRRRRGWMMNQRMRGTRVTSMSCPSTTTL